MCTYALQPCWASYEQNPAAVLIQAAAACTCDSTTGWASKHSTYHVWGSSAARWRWVNQRYSKMIRVTCPHSSDASRNGIDSCRDPSSGSLCQSHQAFVIFLDLRFQAATNRNWTAQTKKRHHLTQGSSRSWIHVGPQTLLNTRGQDIRPHETKHAVSQRCGVFVTAQIVWNSMDIWKMETIHDISCEISEIRSPKHNGLTFPQRQNPPFQCFVHGYAGTQHVPGIFSCSDLQLFCCAQKNMCQDWIQEIVPKDSFRCTIDWYNWLLL